MPEQIGLQAVFDTAQFQAGLNQYVNGLNQAKGATTGVAGVASSAGSILSGTLAVAFGNVLYQAVGAATQALTGFIQNGIQSVAMLQGVQISLESMIASQLMLAGVTDSMSSALQQAIPITDSLMQSLQELSLISPFSYQDVLKTFQLSVAYGASADSALEFTQALLDMASAKNLSGEMIQRLTVSLGQMNREGKISGVTIRELANAGVDMALIMRTQLGMSIDEVNAALASGKLTMDDVIGAFNEFSKANYAGAAERMAQTFNGIKTSLSDLATFAGGELLGPLVQLITADLNSLYLSGKQLLDSGVFTAIGEVIGQVYQALKNVPGAAAEVGAALMDTFGGNIQEVVGEAFNWGVELIANFAEGIITGIADFLVAAMNYLSSVLSSWLSPGSPPRVAPEIDQWGAATMNEYLNGFTDADFSALDSLQGALKDAFGALGLEDTQGLMAGLSAQFAQALAGGGTLDASFFEQLAAAGGQYGDELVRLAKLNLQLAQATEGVAQAEKDVEAAAAKEKAARETSAALVNEYNDLLKSGASQEALDAKLKEINAQEELVAQAAKEKKEAEKRLENQKAIVESLQEQVDLVKKLIQELTALYAKQKAAPGTTPGGGPTTPGGGGGGGGGLGGLPDPADFAAGLQNLLDNAKLQVNDAGNAMWQNLVDKLSLAFQPITDAWVNTILPKLEELRTKFDEFKTDLQAKWTEFTDKMTADFQPVVDWWNTAWPLMASVFEIAWGQIQTAFDAAWATLQPSLDQLDALLKSVNIDGSALAVIAQVLGSILGVVVTGGVMLLVGSINILLALFSGIVQGLTLATVWGKFFVDTLTDGITKFVNGVGQEIKGIFEIVTGTLQGNIETVKQGFIDLIEGISSSFLGAMTAIAAGLGTPFAIILGLVAGFVAGAIDYFLKLSDELVGNSIIPDMMTDMIEAVTDGFGDLLDEIQNFIASTQDSFTDWISTLTNTIRNGLNSVQSIISSQYTNLYNYGKTILTKIGDGIKSASSVITNAIKAAVDAAIAQISGNTGAFYDLGVSLVDNIRLGIQAGGENVNQAFGTVLGNCIVTGYLFIDDFYQLGLRLMEALGNGITAGTDAILTEMGDNMQRIVDEMESKIPAATAAALLAPSSMANRLAPAYAPAGAPAVVNNSNSSRTLNAPINATIQNGMDLAQFEFFIRRIIRSEIGL